jgi:choline-sulfatase
LRELCGADGLELSDAQLRKARHGYYAAISYLDERIGELFEVLRETGLEDSTTVVLTADHGEFLGERGLWYKMSFLDPSARVPLIVRPAGSATAGVRQARRVAAPVSLLDLAPTFLELAGAGTETIAEAEFDGISMAGVVASPEAAFHRPPVVCEYHGEGVLAPSAMVRDGAHKLIVCETDPDQLFDLENDPRELSNLAGDPAHEDVLARLHTELERRLDLAQIGRRVRASQRDRRHVSRGLAQGVPFAWDHTPRVDASMQYVRTRADLYELQRRARMEQLVAMASEPPGADAAAGSPGD